MTLEKVESNLKDEVTEESSDSPPEDTTKTYEKLTTYRLAKKLGKKNANLEKVFLEKGYLEDKDGRLFITQKG